ncbi:glycosyltransferase [Halomonas halodenitrificans]|uniref:glycosyltransferase n=1 Tax=Halomonas halodenitrificans TaxID=28252 RepID=UPI0009FDB3F0|nr:glycosyltransferase [Halomonas halodenitrificans]
MEKHTFIMIRYSILSKTSSWSLNKESDFEEYKEKLFSESRLKKREELFREVTYPSIVSLPKNNVTVLIFVSEEMPEFHYQRLEALISSESNFYLVRLNYSDNINSQMNKEVKQRLKKIKQDVVYATVRLDDDDALSKNYYTLLDKYLEKDFSGYCVSFSYGAAAIVNNGILNEFYLRKKPKIAIGIAWVNRFYHESGELQYKEVSIYSLGNHMKVEEKYPTIIDPREYAWIRTVHDQSDLYDKDMPDKYRKTQKTDKDFLSKYFNFSKVACDE